MAGVIILHGWSDSGKSFESLQAFLNDNMIPAVDVRLGDYISLDDDVRVEDVAKRMQVVIEALLAQPGGPLTPPFDMVTHSTGALVAREWLATCYPDGEPIPGQTQRPCPLKRIVMLAPANFGSVLAAVGKSMIGRLTRGLTNGFQTGEEMLRALELGSPYQWGLTQRDLLARPGADSRSPFGEAKVWPFAIAGARGYDEGLKQIINENGSDGVVRVPAANMNPVGMSLDFTSATGATLTPWTSRTGLDAPFAVLPERDHSEITHPEVSGNSEPPFDARLGTLILDALRCPDLTTYRAMANDWRRLSNQTAMLALTPADAAAQAPLETPRPDLVTIEQVFGDLDHPSPDHFHRYMQVNVVVRDDYGQLVDDYFLEFSDPRGGDGATLTFHQDVLKDVHNNSTSSAYRCLFMDHTALLRIFYGEKANTELVVSISAAAPGQNIKYFDSRTDMAAGQVQLHAADLNDMINPAARFFRNRTHFLEVVIPREPVDDVFAFLP